MKKPSTFMKFGIFIIMFFGLSISMEAQEHKKGGPPSWAPAHGYRANTNYIYFPEKNFYFDLEKRSYIYFSSGNWQVSAALPGLFASVDLGKSVQIELALDTSSPQKFNSVHVIEYKSKHKTHKKPKGKGKGRGKKTA